MLECPICHKKHATHYYYEYSLYKDVCDNQECFSDMFWLYDILPNYDNNTVTIKGEVYYIHADNPIKKWSGFAGREFIIKKFNSNELIVTHNLWYRGKVPDKFLDKFPDDAEFIEGKVGNNLEY